MGNCLKKPTYRQPTYRQPTYWQPTFSVVMNTDEKDKITMHLHMFLQTHCEFGEHYMISKDLLYIAWERYKSKHEIMHMVHIYPEVLKEYHVTFDKTKHMYHGIRLNINTHVTQDTRFMSDSCEHHTCDTIVCIAPVLDSPCFPEP